MSNNPSPGVKLTYKPKMMLRTTILPVEIWFIIFKELKVKRKKSLAKLRLTSKYLNSLVTPLLFEDVRITKFETIVGEEFEHFLASSHVEHVKKFTITTGNRYAHTNRTPDEESELYALLNARLVEGLSKMPNLESFSFGLFGNEKLPSEKADGVNHIPIQGAVLDTLCSIKTMLQHLTIYIPGFLEDRAYFPSRRGLEINDYRAQFVTFPIPKELGTFQKLSTFKVVYPCSREVENWASLISTSLAETLFSSSNLEEVHIDVPCKDSDRSETLGDVSRQYVDMGGEPLKLRHLSLTEELMEFNVPLVPSLNDRLAGLASLVDLSRLESLAFHEAEEYHWQRPHVFYDRMLLYQAVTDHTCFCSLRRLNLPQLNGEMLRILNRVGMDALLPPYFLSELIFGCSYVSGYRTGLRVRVQKRAYWPKTFAVGTKGYHDEPLVDSICKWQGLERLSICLDLETPRGRTSARRISTSLAQNLRELALLHPKLRNVDSELVESMARSLCVGNHLQYLSIANIGFRVVRDATGPGFELEQIDRQSSEAEEAEIFNLMRV